MPLLSESLAISSLEDDFSSLIPGLFEHVLRDKDEFRLINPVRKAESSGPSLHDRVFTTKFINKFSRPSIHD